MDVENDWHAAADIATIPADVEWHDSYEDEIERYRSKKFTYIPMPAEGMYYNIQEEQLHDMEFGQFLDGKR